ncbi:centromere protein L [Anabrus simplex]|uniref:centromere protein L n=1 Tax=Anabrus simplex TaxID=316456 RepID=UPI0035A28F7D
MSREDESGNQIDHGAPPSPYFHRLLTSIHTPRPDRRSIKFVQPHDSSDESEYSKALEDICGKSWKLFRVSPLHRFEYSAIRLRQYGKKLREYLSVLKKSKEDMEYQAAFSVVDDLTRVPEDYEAIKVKVTCSKNGAAYNSYYEGLFISWGSTRPPIGLKGVVSLPLLLCRGTAGLTNAVHALLANFFDCSINRLVLTEEEVFWLSAMLPAVCPASRRNSRVEFHYSVPGIETQGGFSVYCTHQTLIDLWKSIHDDQKDELLYSEIMTLQDGLMEHVYCVYGVNLGLCRLEKIISRDLYLASNGVLKVRSTTLADKLLSFICTVSVILDCATPSLCVQGE